MKATDLATLFQQVLTEHPGWSSYTNLDAPGWGSPMRIACRCGENLGIHEWVVYGDTSPEITAAFDRCDSAYRAHVAEYLVHRMTVEEFGLSADQIDEYANRFKAREAAAALVAAQTALVTSHIRQEFLGEVARTSELIATVDATLARLAEITTRLSEQVRAGANAGVEKMKPHLDAVQEAIRSVAPEDQS